GCKSPVPSVAAPFQRLAKPWRGKGNEALDLGLGQPVLAVDEVDRYRVRLEVEQDELERALDQRRGRLIGEHSGDAQPGLGGVDGRLRRIDDESGAHSHAPPLLPAEGPAVRRREGIEADAVMA